MASPYRPSPLSHNSQRSSPFRRPSSPSSPTTVIGRPSTPPSRSAPSPMTSPSKLKQSFTMSDQEEEEAASSSTSSGPQSKPQPPLRSQTEPPPSPTTRGATNSPIANPFSMRTVASKTPNNQTSQTDILTKLPPPLLHSMRESFSVLDSNSTGTINATAVLETMSSIGLQDQSNTISQFFPAGGPQQLSLPQYLNQLAAILVQLSPQQELLNAFAAFDDDDSGQIDVAELRDALLSTAADAGERALTGRDVDKAVEGFTGRRILGKHAVGISGVRGLDGGRNKKNGDVFRYQEFVGSLLGGSGAGVEGQAVPAR